MIEKLDAFRKAKLFYIECKTLRLPKALREQLTRASSSIALNVAEGSGKPTLADRRRFYAIALGSLRECQAIIAIEDQGTPKLNSLSDDLGAMLFRMSTTPKSEKK